MSRISKRSRYSRKTRKLKKTYGGSTSQLSVLGKPLKVAGLDPVTGFYRDGYCVTGPLDMGTHVVAAVMTKQFLEFTKSMGNDLITPQLGFPGLKPGDHWCLCALRWMEAYKAGVAPPVDLDATSKAALHFVPLRALKKHTLK
jgi:uncharacterized protein (DUF2237 family)